jgi:hypothetical protein
MIFFIRFTSSIENDIERGTSWNTGTDEVIDGLCAFYGMNTLEETIKRAKVLSGVVGNEGEFAVIVKAVENVNAKKGSLGVVIKAESIQVIESFKI